MIRKILNDGTRLYEAVAVCPETGDVFHVWNAGMDELDPAELAAGYVDKVFGKVYFMATAPDCSPDARNTLAFRYGDSIASYVRGPIRGEGNLVSRIMLESYGRLRDFVIISNFQEGA